MGITFTILGCGNSSGVPAIGNYWGKCDPSEPKNRRTRSSALIQSDEATLVVDTGPDFKEQLNRYDIRDLDAILYTHHHGDHVHGIDDIRPLSFHNGKKSYNCYGNLFTLNELELRFEYLFKGGKNEVFYPPILNKNPFKESDYGKALEICDISFVPYEMDHGTCTAVGYRFGDLAYSIDMKALDDKALEIISGVKIWIVDASGYKNPENAVHADLETIYEYNKIVGAQNVYVSSLSPSMDYEILKRELPSGFYPSYDGLSFSL